MTPVFATLSTFGSVGQQYTAAALLVCAMALIVVVRRTSSSSPSQKRWTVGSLDSSRAAVKHWSESAPISLDAKSSSMAPQRARKHRSEVVHVNAEDAGFVATKEWLKHGPRRIQGTYADTPLCQDKGSQRGPYTSMTTSWTIETTGPEEDITPRQATQPPRWTTVELQSSTA